MHPAIINQPASLLNASLYLPGDKSVSHRAVFISAISKGKTRVNNFLFSEDSLATIDAFCKLGVKIKLDKSSKRAVIFGKGLHGLSKPKTPIHIEESGTTYRILAGILSGQEFTSFLTAGKALSKRPMRRITEPLRLMGAEIKSKIKNIKSKIEEYPPLKIKGGNLKAITYKIPVASAQVKSAILFAGLYAKGMTKVIEPLKTRDHTERMLKLFGANIKEKGKEITLTQHSLVSPGIIYIPADISSAAFFIVLASLLPGSDLIIKSLGINPTRAGLISKLKEMGAKIELRKENRDFFEPMADARVKSAALHGTTIKCMEIPLIIDELPIFMVAASLAKGKTVIEGAQELRVKETDRINSMQVNLKKMGANIRVKKKGSDECIEIIGVDRLKGACVKSFGDHRTAMSMVIAGLLAQGRTCLDDTGCIDKSFPGFIGILKHLLGRYCITAKE
ncbi:MAG: 3-phosphoshikimate 1-carboxyvinyltransferase [Candidatus Omnitrophota bacterium]|nr:3-phosphoshikimate 1-carboxyvinyltransferase [Candidatus Omnitrophota bacterium]